MRIAVMLRRLPLRHELSTSVMDAEAMAALVEAGHDVCLFVDEQGPGVDLIRRAGGTVAVSPKRPVNISGWVTADHSMALQIASANAESPLDAIVVSPEVGTDPSWFVPELGRIPLGMVLGDEIHRITRLVTSDPVRRSESLLGQWAAAGALLDADFLVGAASPADFGIRCDLVPPIVSLGGAVATIVEEGPVEVGLLAIVATVCSRSELATIVTRAWEVVPVGEETITVVVVPPINLTAETPGDLVLSGVAPSRRGGVIVAPAGLDGVASSFLASADVVAAAGPADVGIPGVAELSPKVPVLNLGGPVPHRGSLAEVAPTRQDGAPRTILSGTIDEMAPALEEVSAGVAILHEGRGSQEAARLFATPHLSPHAVTVLARPAPIHGAADPSTVSPFVLAVGSDTVPAVRYVMDDCDTLWDLIRTLLAPINANHIAVRVLPTAIGVATRAVTGVVHPRQLFGTGPLDVAAEIPAPAPPPARPTTPPDTDIRRWIKGRRWTDRARLALPWKFGLLRRAMKDRW